MEQIQFAKAFGSYEKDGRQFDKQQARKLGGCSINDKVGMMAKYCKDPIATKYWKKEQSGKNSYVS